MKRYYSASDYYKNIFGEKVYKIALDGGMSCPNRDENKKGGCIFCSAGGSGDFAAKRTTSVKAQIESAIRLVEGKNPKAFIAYYQSYTNTYAPIDYLRKLFNETIGDERIIALSIATRPDCISDECIELLKELNGKKKVFVELGLQTSDDKTAELINRGYKSEVYAEVTEKLRSNGINVITHVIIGLPHENEETLLNTIHFINDKTDGVKLQLLHILKGTRLASMYDDGKYVPLKKEEYYHLLSECINHLNKNIVVHRITGDAPKRLLIEPKWSADKKQVLNGINRYFEENDVIQGKNL